MFWLLAMSFKIDSMSNPIPCIITEIMNKSWKIHLPNYIQKIFSVKKYRTFFLFFVCIEIKSQKFTNVSRCQNGFSDFRNIYEFGRFNKNIINEYIE